MQQHEDGWQRSDERQQESGVFDTANERILPAGTWGLSWLSSRAGLTESQEQGAGQGQSPIPGWLHWLESTATASRGFPGQCGADEMREADHVSDANLACKSEYLGWPNDSEFAETKPEDLAAMHPPRSQYPAPLAQASYAPSLLAALTHDARSMVTALGLYCDLLEEPGVMAAPYQHYARELRLVATASRRLVEQLSAWSPESSPDRFLDSRQGWLPGLDGGIIPFPKTTESPAAEPPGEGPTSEGARREGLPRLDNGAKGINNRISRPAAAFSRSTHSNRFAPGEPIASLADELMANRNLLGALAGPAITVGLSLSGGYLPIAMAGDDLTRVLVNLVKNASEAMLDGGHIQINLIEKPKTLLVTVSDTGCGFPAADIEAVFAPGYSTHIDLDADEDHILPQHRGLGLAITRSLVTATGGQVWAANRPESLSDAEEEALSGAIVLIEFPRIE